MLKFNYYYFLLIPIILGIISLILLLFGFRDLKKKLKNSNFISENQNKFKISTYTPPSYYLDEERIEPLSEDRRRRLGIN